MGKISYVNSATSTATSLTYPTGIQAGDYILYYGYRTTTTAPSLPSGFTNIANGSGDANALRIAYKVAAGTESGTTSPAYTNATQVAVAVYRNVTGIGDFKTKDGTTSPASFTAMTLNGTNGMSWIAGFIGSKQGTSTATPSGLTNRSELKNSTTSMIDVYDTNSAVNSQSFGTSALGSSTDWFTANIELLGTNSPPNAPSLSSPSNGATGISVTPSLAFSATDPDSDSLAYEVQVDTSSGFNSQGGGGAAPALVQQNDGVDGNGAVGSVSVAYTSSNTAGNMLYAAISIGAGSNSHLTGFSDTQGNSWTKAVDYNDASAEGVQIWVAPNCKGGANTVSVSDAGYASAMFIGEVSNVNIVDQILTAAVYGAAPATGSTGTLTYSNEFVLAVAASGGGSNATQTAYTVGTGYSNLLSELGTYVLGGVESMVVSSTSPVSASFASGGSSVYYNAMAIVTFGFGGPLIDASSSSGGHDASQFSDTTNPGDSSPFPSGDSIQYIVPAAESLTAGTTYYWRVRAIDVAGTDTYSSWSSTDSFTVSSGGTPTPSNLFFPFL